MTTTEMSPRNSAVLDAIVERYILTGEPVGWPTIVKLLDEPVSPATVRNVMAELERLGYLEQPHTSAGRMPTRRGYRCSLHLHKNKDEVFYVATGRILLELGDGERVMGPGDHHHIPQGVEHRFWGLEDAEIFEFSTHHDDEDSYRVPGEESCAFDWAELEGRV